MHTTQGFILTKHSRDVPSAQGLSAQLKLWVKTKQEVIELIFDNQELVLFIAQTDALRLKPLSQTIDARIHSQPRALTDFDKHPMAAVYCPSHQSLKALTQALDAHEIAYFEHDIRLHDRFLMERFIQGGIEINQPSAPKIKNPQCRACDFLPDFSSVSLDLECSEKGVLYSVGLDSTLDSRVIMVNPLAQEEYNQKQDYLIQWVKNEAALLHALIAWFERFDPDLILGWNVIDFDCQLLDKRAKAHQIPLSLGRDKSQLYFRKSNQSNQGFVSIAGRLVLDGIHMLKAATYSFSSWSLENVAQSLLAQGKTITPEQNKMAQINHLFAHDKEALAQYNWQDCRLVVDIFKHTHLLEFLIERTRLTGLDLDRIGGSVAAFTNLYLPRLHRAGYVAPNLASENWIASPGGYVMDSTPGLYDSVLVLDFKSLYPSIIRSFKIDPLGLIEGLDLPIGKGDNEAIPGFRGGQFHRSRHFLPKMIENLWQAREKAKANKEVAFSTAIKIIMNSFYGVLGSSGCRFFDTRLASSITMRGHEIMKKTCQLIEDKGYQVIYGDTDSLFVALNTPHSNQAANQIGQDLVHMLNLWWQEHLQNEYALESALELEYETHYARFLMPTIRGAQTGSKKRYCGLIKQEIEENGQVKTSSKLIFKGLESARSDWTELAQKFQAKLYQMVFELPDPHTAPELQDYVRKIVEETLAGQHDSDLVYQKRLRQRLSEYQKNIPPQVRAAREADQKNQALGKPLRYQNKGAIRYVITLSGPQAVEYQDAAFDYQHYIDKQLKPVADAILPFIDLDFESIIAPQIGLF